ncbi:hypothetical protein [Adhaeribacter rhizoryzae]|uniref:Uncharacterized protein n=1 Tax=Adhaeribacter rhizoryzae TaxID=2607907 RepID=A0A5M6D3A2_9BACT|nr:hypothetical protein [Adhaeribacter rhizoryzae]KAA5541977.1 hypothetical protein F0145_19515 [Adhaeribacter rhizoryzae]
MIKIKHPDEKCNFQQEQFLANCPESERRFHELLFTNGNISYRYHMQAKEFSPTVKDYEEWLEGLPENIRKSMQEKGFESCKTILSFTRYVNEKNDIGMDEYIRQQMGAEDYAEYHRVCLNQDS